MDSASQLCQGRVTACTRDPFDFAQGRLFAPPEERQGLVTALIGVAIGIGGAFALTRTLRSFLFGLSPTDPVTFAGVAFLLILVALLACYFPARRAAKVDPIEALRYD